MLFTVNLPLLAGGIALAGTAASALYRTQFARAQKENANRLVAERAAGHHLCFSTIEALAYAIEASDRFSQGHLDRVQRVVAALTRVFDLPEAEAMSLRAAALLHHVGRLGVPEHILHKPDSLTPEEIERLRVHPVLGARILASVPFPWEVVPIVRHHAEHWDGGGYPDGLSGSAIPFTSRILAVANAYSALLSPRSYRPAFTPMEALAEIEARSGTQFDPAVVAAFRNVAAQLRAEEEQTPFAQRLTLTPDSRAALDDIAAAQHETQSLYQFSQSVNGSLHLEAVCENLMACIREVVPCSTCAIFVPEEDGEFLRVCAARGINDRHLLGSSTRIGTYLTGRAYSRNETATATYLDDDILLRHVSDVWTPLRSTLIIPLSAEGGCVGTLNLYDVAPDAFPAQTHRILRLLATQAAHAIDNARRFAAAQETANTDPMTGLRNARYLNEYLERELNRARREELSLAVLNIDLDNFKPVNDGFGHGRGDQILREVGAILQAHVRNYDLAARYAGDEFVVVLSHADREGAEIVLQKLKEAVERHGQRLIAREPNFPAISISVGVAVFPEDGIDRESLLCRSDAAMYLDKRQNKALSSRMREVQAA